MLSGFAIVQSKEGAPRCCWNSDLVFASWSNFQFLLGVNSDVHCAGEGVFEGFAIVRSKEEAPRYCCELDPVFASCSNFQFLLEVTSDLHSGDKGFEGFPIGMGSNIKHKLVGKYACIDTPRIDDHDVSLQIFGDWWGPKGRNRHISPSTSH